jgi:hypothetical protein
VHLLGTGDTPETKRDSLSMCPHGVYSGLAQRNKEILCPVKNIAVVSVWYRQGRGEGARGIGGGVISFRGMGLGRWNLGRTLQGDGGGGQSAPGRAPEHWTVPIDL